MSYLDPNSQDQEGQFTQIAPEPGAVSDGDS
jgi:hypothetical protein